MNRKTLQLNLNLTTLTTVMLSSKNQKKKKQKNILKKTIKYKNTPWSKEYPETETTQLEMGQTNKKPEQEQKTETSNQVKI